jgi:hypothetical protein
MKNEEKVKYDPADPLLTNRFGFIEAIIERWKIDGQNILWSFQGFNIHNGEFEVLIEVESIFRNQYLKRTIMNKKTSVAPKDVLAVNFPSLNDDFYEAESISQKSVFRVMFLLLFFFHSRFLFLSFISYMS